MDSPRACLWLRRAFIAAALFSFVMALVPQPPTLPGAPGDKVQHMLAFFTLGTLAAAGWRHTRIWRLFILLAAFGAAIEVFQAIPALNRHADGYDWLADMAAAVAALLLTRIVLRRRA